MEKEEISVQDIYSKLNEIINFLLSKWKTITLAAFIGSSIGLTISILSEKNYKSSVTFILDEKEAGASGGGLANLASSFGFGLGGGSNGGLFTTTNILEFLKSRNLIEKTLLSEINSEIKKPFVEVFLDEYNWRDKLKENVKTKNIKFSASDNRSKFSVEKDSVLGMIYQKIVSEDLSVSQPNEENSIILISFKNKNEIFAKEFPIKLLSIVSDHYIRTKIKKSRANVSVLQKQVDSVRLELYAALQGAASANDNVFGLNPSMNIQRVPSIKKQVDIQANTAILTELVKNLEVSKMSLLNQTPLIEIIDKPILPLEEIKVKKSIAIVVGAILAILLTIIFLLSRKSILKFKQIK